jgi:hypothetical protein
MEPIVPTLTPRAANRDMPLAVTATVTRAAMLRAMKIGEWDNLGPAQALLVQQLGQLGTVEYATHVTVNADNGRLRVLVASDVGLLDYNYLPMGPDPNGPWILRGQVTKWSSVRGLRLVTEAQLAESGDASRSVWRFVGEEPRVELSANSDEGDAAIGALLALARACYQNAG